MKRLDLPKPTIVYFQTITACDGHCRYCPFDDVYKDNPDNFHKMSDKTFYNVIDQLAEWDFRTRIGFLLHYEPTLDNRLPKFCEFIRHKLPTVKIEMATNGLHNDSEVLKSADKVKSVLAGSLTTATSRAGNVRACPETAGRSRLNSSYPHCTLPEDTMCIAANGDILLCCQDWRREMVVGFASDIFKARGKSLSLVPAVKNKSLQFCKDCHQNLNYEQVKDRIGKRGFDING